MEKELKKKHLDAIKKQFIAAGLPETLTSELLADFSPESGKRMSWSFETHIGRTNVKGKIHAQPNTSDGLYALDYYQVNFSKSTNKFLCVPWSWVMLEEAVNLMQGRYVYRQPDLDPIGEGYWIYLTREELLPGFRRLGFLRDRFDVGNYLAETGLGGWLGLTGWKQLVENLEKGYRSDLVIGGGTNMRVIQLQADPRGQLLQLFDIQGNEIELETLMKRKGHGNPE